MTDAQSQTWKLSWNSSPFRLLEISLVKSKFILTGTIYGDVESFGQLKIEMNKQERQGKVLIKNQINTQYPYLS